MQQITFQNINLANLYLQLNDSRGSHDFFSANIIRMEASDNYTIVYANGQRPFIVCKVLKCYEELLKPFGFVRTHRSHLVNKHFVKQIGSDNVVMQDASVAKITKRKRKSCLSELKK